MEALQPSRYCSPHTFRSLSHTHSYSLDRTNNTPPVLERGYGYQKVARICQNATAYRPYQSRDPASTTPSESAMPWFPVSWPPGSSRRIPYLWEGGSLANATPALGFSSRAFKRSSGMLTASLVLPDFTARFLPGVFFAHRAVTLYRTWRYPPPDCQRMPTPPPPPPPPEKPPPRPDPEEELEVAVQSDCWRLPLRDWKLVPSCWKPTTPGVCPRYQP